MSEITLHHINNHEFVVLEDYGSGDNLVECRNCLVRDVITKDGGEYVASGCVCHIEWLRKPDGGFCGIALRNGIGFTGRELIAVDERSEVTDTVRVYDEDTPLLGRLLKRVEWQRRQVDVDEKGERR